MTREINYNKFREIDIRVGTIISCEEFKEARKPAYKLQIDLGELGIKKSSAQITQQYSTEELIGKQVLCVVNFPKKQIGPLMSEVLTMGFDDNKGIILATVDKKTENGKRLY